MIQLTWLKCEKVLIFFSRFILSSGIAGLIPGPSGMHNNSQDSYGKLELFYIKSSFLLFFFFFFPHRFKSNTLWGDEYFVG